MNVSSLIWNRIGCAQPSPPRADDSDLRIGTSPRSSAKLASGAVGSLARFDLDLEQREMELTELLEPAHLPQRISL